jgi:hypothetical protein
MDLARELVRALDAAGYKSEWTPLGGYSVGDAEEAQRVQDSMSLHMSTLTLIRFSPKMLPPGITVNSNYREQMGEYIGEAYSAISSAFRKAGIPVATRYVSVTAIDDLLFGELVPPAPPERSRNPFSVATDITAIAPYLHPVLNVNDRGAPFVIVVGSKLVR